MGNTLWKAFNGFGSEILSRLRQNVADHISDAEFEERIIGIEKATAAMIEAEVDKEIITEMLQKYWDLRPSEARAFVEQVEDCNGSF